MVNDDITSSLVQVGLSEKSATVYAFLLGAGGAYPSTIAEATKLNRSTIYKILTDLSVKRLVVEVVKGKKLYFQAERPARFLRFVEDAAKQAESAFLRAKQLLPEMEGIYSLTPNKPKIRFFENREGLRSIFEDHVAVKKKYEMLGFANAAELEKFMTPEFLRRYIKKKERIGIITRGILPNTALDLSFDARLYAGIRKSIHIDIRHIPAEEFPFNGEITIYGTNKVSIINFDKVHLVGIIIEDQAIHDMMTRIFELAWRGAKYKK